MGGRRGRGGPLTNAYFKYSTFEERLECLIERIIEVREIDTGLADVDEVFISYTRTPVTGKIYGLRSGCLELVTS